MEPSWRQVRSRLQHLIPPPVEPLARNVRSTDNSDIRIHQKQRQDLPMPRSRWVCEFERLDLVLEDIGKGDEATFACIDGPKILHAVAPVADTEYGIEPVVLVLIWEFIEEFCIGLLTER